MMDLASPERPSAAPYDGALLEGSLAAILAKLDAIEQRLRSLERASQASAGLPPGLGEMFDMIPKTIATATDAIDDEFARAAARGRDIDRALRNWVSAALHFGESITQPQIDALTAFLRSDVLHPAAVEVFSGLGRAVAETARQPRGSAGLGALLGALRDENARRSLAFLLEIARRFGAALDHTPSAPGAQRPHA